MPRLSELTTTRAELQSLQQVRATLSEALANQAVQLKSSGSLPSEDLLNELVRYGARLSSLSAELITAGMTGTHTPVSFAHVTLDALQLSLESHETRLRYQPVLQRITRLIHVDDTRFPPLQRCQVQATELLGLLGAELQPTNIAPLEEQMRPFEAMTTLLASGSDLPDEVWTTCHELVTSCWGRSLSTALARGRICAAIDAETQFAAASLATPDLSNIAAASEGASSEVAITSDHDPISSDENEISAQTNEEEDDAIIFDNQQELIFDAIGRPGTERSPSHTFRSLDLKLLSDEPWGAVVGCPLSVVRGGGGARSHGTFHVSNRTLPALDGKVQELARRVLEAEPENRSATMSQLILQLLWEDHPALAYHLATTVDMATELQSTPPAWLVHALALCRHQCYSQGEIARQLEQDLGLFHTDLVNSDDAEINAAQGFFVRAAALLPALLAASPAAASILKSFQISPGLSRLYNYCGRILTYGKQFQGHATDLFTPDVDLDEWTEELAGLQQSIEQWLPGIINQYCTVSESTQLYLHAHWTLTASTATRHERAVHCWSKWQEVLRIVDRLLTPVLAGDSTERNWVKSEIERLSHNTRLETSADQPNAQLPLGVMLFPEESMLDVIRQAIDFANRWLRLCASKPGEGRTLASRDAQILRDEILDRTDDVVAELVAYSTANNSVGIKVGIACLCRTIEHLRTIFSPHSTLALRETDPREVLSNELQDMPQLELDGDGMPIAASAELQDLLLAYLRDGSSELAKNSDLRFTDYSRRPAVDAEGINPNPRAYSPEYLNQPLATGLSNCCFE